jgi:hypothetical protein
MLPTHAERLFAYGAKTVPEARLGRPAKGRDVSKTTPSSCTVRVTRLPQLSSRKSKRLAREWRMIFASASCAPAVEEQLHVGVRVARGSLQLNLARELFRNTAERP